MNFDERIKTIHNIRNLMSKRILNEIIDDEEKHYLFVKRRKEKPPQQGSGYRPQSNRPYKRTSYQKRY